MINFKKNLMLKYASLLFSVFLSVTAFAQSTVGLGTTNNSQTLYLSNMIGKEKQPFNGMDLEGSPYLNEEFVTACVETNRGYKASNVLVRFNIYTNAFEFKQNKSIFELINVKLVKIMLNDFDSSAYRLFATGFPAVDDHTNTSFYEVLNRKNKIQLIKYYTQKLEDVKTMGFYNKKQLALTVTYYLFQEGMQPQKIKLNESALLKALPDYADQIHKIKNEQQLELKHEKDVATLLDSL